jgi:hypothetical protein
VKLIRLALYVFGGTVLLGGCAFTGLRSELLTSAPTIETRPPIGSSVRFNARAIVAVSDADMAGTAYADGRLRRIAGSVDQLSVVTEFSEASKKIAQVPTSNSVMAWPGAIDLSPDGRFGYVVETVAPAPANVENYASIQNEMPSGKILTTVDLSNPTVPRIVSTTEIGNSPASVHIAPNGRWAAVAKRDHEAPLVFVALNAGQPGQVFQVALDLPKLAQRSIDDGILFARIHPGGNIIALNIANTHVAFARTLFDGTGNPTGAQLIGELIKLPGTWLTMMRWSNDGRHLLISDVGWGPTQLGSVLNGAGHIISIKFNESGAHREVSRSKVSLSPEGFEISPQGDLIVAVNMERTYLPPSGFPYVLFGRQDRYSLSLVSFDIATGRLTMIDGPVGFRGVLPEDAVFDNDGSTIAVVVYHERAESPKAAWIEYVKVDRSGGTPRLIVTGQRTALPRGAHDLAVIR